MGGGGRVIPAMVSEFLAPNWGPVSQLPNVFGLCLSGVNVGDIFLC